ncbi:MAG: hypothetical protein AAFQ29_02720 [Pseudomonadota bacterium]
MIFSFSRVRVAARSFIPGAVMAACLVASAVAPTWITPTTGAHAQTAPDPISQPGVSIVSFDVAQLGPILTEMKYLWQARQAPDGSPFILANSGGDSIFVITPLACRGTQYTDCVGMQLISVFDDKADPEAVRDFNNRYVFSNVGINDNGNSYISRYDIADYGIARGNVATIISTFVTFSEIYAETIVESHDAITFRRESGLSTKVSRLNETDKNGLVLNANLGPGGVARSRFDAEPHNPRLREAYEKRQQIFDDAALPLNRLPK